jgi:hypothetical protein
LGGWLVGALAGVVGNGCPGGYLRQITKLSILTVARHAYLRFQAEKSGKFAK